MPATKQYKQDILHHGSPMHTTSPIKLAHTLHTQAVINEPLFLLFKILLPRGTHFKMHFIKKNKKY